MYVQRKAGENRTPELMIKQVDIILLKTYKSNTVQTGQCNNYQPLWKKKTDSHNMNPIKLRTFTTKYNRETLLRISIEPNFRL